MLTVDNLHKSYGAKQALAGLSFEVQPAEILAILGPSGCGKSTLLSLIAGLETPDQGSIAWEGNSLAGAPPHQRGFGLMFQDFALFPHLDVFANVAFGLRMQHTPPNQVLPQAQAALELVGLPGYARRDVNTLSGGEQQRVALARALAPRPRLLMLDEPLGSLDRSLRERLVLDLRAILHRSRQTAIYVTHDQEEAFTLADHLILMREGRIEQAGLPEQIYCQPASLFAARFLGQDNLLPGRILSIDPAGAQVQTAAGQLFLPGLPARYQPGAQITILLRPDAVHLGESGPHSLSGVLVEAVFRGSLTRTTIIVNGVELRFDFPSRQGLPAPGQPVQFSFDPAQALQGFDEIEPSQ
jgi:ABC-type Fe3+/spermidine/putrescine transport system ATPase subunit